MKLEIVSPAALGILLAFAGSAHAVCLPNALPQFTVGVQANAFMQNDCSPQLLQLNVLGPSLIGNADATGTAALGSLKAIAHADYSLAQPNGQFSISGAEVGFSDRFAILIPGVPGTGVDVLAFTLTLSGTIGAVGNPNTGSVKADLHGSSSFDLGEQSELDAPGTAVLGIAVGIGVDNRIDLDGLLSIAASAGGPGNVTVDFSDTFAVTGIRLLDASGNLIDDNVVLTDASGNVLGAPPASAVPEPPSAPLLAAGLGLLAVAGSRGRR